jgi:hypothetical protein
MSSLLGSLPDVDHNIRVTSVLGFHQLKFKQENLRTVLTNVRYRYRIRQTC